MKLKLLSMVLGAAALVGCEPEGPRTFPFEETAIVVGREATAEFAAKELSAIVKLATGREFKKVGGESRWTADVGSDGKKVGGESRGTSAVQPSTFNLQPSHRIFIGRSPESEAILGAAAFDSLGEEESAVFAKGDDLFLIGGDASGVLWSVYDFCEDSLGYRWFLERSEKKVGGESRWTVEQSIHFSSGEKIDKTDVVRYNGKPSRRKPKFTGYRTTDWHPNTRLFRLRNRETGAIKHFCTNFVYRYAGHVPGHGFGFFIPLPGGPCSSPWGIPKAVYEMRAKDPFRDHPEWFSLMPDGTRNPDHQLCFSNRGCRDELTRIVLAWMKAAGPGAYQVGVNDARFGALCYCEGCKALAKKYNTNGGPLWDYLVELCKAVKEAHPEGGYYVQSLAYDGLDQTEKAPDNIVFPDNFMPDIAYIHVCDRPIKQLPDKRAPEGEMVNYWQNTLKWCSITKQRSYWYYGTACPMVVYRRMQEEFRQLHEAGIQSVFTCGHGGGYEFGDLTGRLAAKLLYDPDCDIRKEVEDAVKFKYGPAAPEMLEFIDSMEKVCLDHIAHSGSGVLNTDHCYQGMNFLKGKDIAAWRAIFERAEGKLNDSTVQPSTSNLQPLTFYRENVRFAKLVVDLFTVVLEKRVHEEAPECKFDTAAVKQEGIAIAEEYGRKFLKKGQKNEALRIFEQAEKELAYYGNLKDENALPGKLAGYQAAFVTRLLPVKSEKFFCGGYVEGKLTSEPDAQAICGYRVADDIPAKRDISKGIPYYIWDGTAARQRMGGRIPLSIFKKDEYVLYKLGETELSPQCSLIFDELWGSPLAGNYLGRCFNPAAPKRRYEVWISLRAEGPKFFPDDTRKDRLSFEQIFVCEIVGSGQ